MSLTYKQMSILCEKINERYLIRYIIISLLHTFRLLVLQCTLPSLSETILISLKLNQKLHFFFRDQPTLAAKVALFSLFSNKMN